MSTEQHETRRERILRGVGAPLRWGLFGVSGVLLVVGTIVQGFALVAMAGANRLTGQAHA